MQKILESVQSTIATVIADETLSEAQKSDILESLSSICNDLRHTKLEQRAAKIQALAKQYGEKTPDTRLIDVAKHIISRLSVTTAMPQISEEPRMLDADVILLALVQRFEETKQWLNHIAFITANAGYDTRAEDKYNTVLQAAWLRISSENQIAEFITKLLQDYQLEELKQEEIESLESIVSRAKSGTLQITDRIKFAERIIDVSKKETTEG